MYILAIETTGAYASVAVTDGEKILGNIQGHDRFSHLQNLMPQVESVMKNSGLQLGDVAAIATSVGPGSFTGIRIGVSSSRALSQILGIPCVPVSSLQGLALRVANQESSDGDDHRIDFDENTLICPMLDARRSQIYAGGYIIKDGYPQEVVKAAPYGLEEFIRLTDKYEKIIVLGDGADSYGEKIEELRSQGVVIAPENIRYQHADTVAQLGFAQFQRGEGVGFENLEPDYMRIPEAERKLKEKQNVGNNNTSSRA